MLTFRWYYIEVIGWPSNITKLSVTMLRTAEKNLTQEGLALKADISRTHISHTEADNANKSPSPDILFRICEVLDIEPYKLFLEDKEK